VSSGSDSSSETGDVWGDDEGELMLHAREVVLLRPAKPPVQVLAPVPKAMRAVLQSAGLM
jgi:hypothetical protein